MRVKTISVTYERKINLGNYDSAHIGLTLWADVDEGEDHTEVATTLQAEARDLARAEFRRLREKSKSPANGTL